MAKITRYQKPGQIQFAPLPYEGMINRAYQQVNKQQDMNIKASEQLGALQGQIASYDVSEADRAQYDQFQKEAFQTIDEFSKANKGRYSDPEVAREFAKTITTISGDPKLQLWKNNKIQKDQALQDLYKNRDSYTQFDFDNAIEEISTHQGVTPEGYNPFMGVGIKKGVDWTTSTLKLGNMVADIYKEDFQGLSDSEKMLKISQSFRDANYITNKVLPVIKEDERMWDEAKRYAKAQGLTDPQDIEQEALNYVTGKVSASAGLLAREKTQASVTGAGSGSGTKDKVPGVALSTTTLLGQPGSEIKNQKDLRAKKQGTRDAFTAADQELMSFESEVAKGNITKDANGKYTQIINGQKTDVTSRYFLLKKNRQEAKDKFAGYVERDRELQKKRKELQDADPKYQSRMEQFREGMTAWEINAAKKGHEAILDWEQDLLRRGANPDDIKMTPGVASSISKPFIIEAAEQIISNTSEDDLKTYNAMIEDGATEEAYMAFPDLAKANEILNGGISFSTGAAYSEEWQDKSYQYYKATKASDEKLDKYLEELAKTSVYETELYRYDKDTDNQGRVNAFTSGAALSGALRDARTNQPLDEELITYVENYVQDSENRKNIQYAGMALDYGGVPVEIFTIPHPDGEDKEPLKVEVDNKEALMVLVANGKTDMVRYGVEKEIQNINQSANKQGKISLGKYGDIDIKIQEDGSILADMPARDGTIIGDDGIRKSRNEYLNNEHFFNAFVNHSNSILQSTGSISTGKSRLGNNLKKKNSVNDAPQSSRQSPAVRNNNPGNIRPEGKDDEFVKYDTPEEGKQAMINDLTTKATGKSKHSSKITGKKLGPNSTIDDVISVYAPKSENNSAEYANSVRTYLGVDANTPMSSIPPEKLAEAMSRIEDSTMHAKVFADEIKAERNFISETGTTIFDYEAKKGGASGQALDNFGFLKSKHGEVKTKEQALKIFEEEYMSKVPKIYPNQIRESLGDWKFNSGRSISDLLLLADGKITGNQIQNEPEHKRLWAKNRARIEKEMLANPAKWKQKIKQAKHIAYKIKDPNTYTNTWKERIDIFG